MPANERSEARERILQTAADLFYRHGYRATGINEVIARAGVAKATFYAHFPTKDDLCLAYLRRRNAREAEEVMACVNSKRTPRSRFLAVMESMEPWAVSTGFRGCQFINLVPEVPDPSSALRVEGQRHYTWVRELVEELATELIASDPGKYGHLEVGSLTDSYLSHLVGAIALAGVYNELWPIKSGIKSVRRLLS